MDFARILKAAEAVARFGQAAKRFRDGLSGAGGGAPAAGAEPFGAEAESAADTTLAAGNRVFGQLEARLAGVLVSALKEAFDRDRAHMEMEREQLEHERKRAEALMRLELLRQAGERELQSIRASGAIALVVWITSVVFTMLRGSGFGTAGIVVLAIGWIFLLAALASAFAAYRQMSALLHRGAIERIESNAVLRSPLAQLVPVLIVVGLGCTAASLLIVLAG